MLRCKEEIAFNAFGLWLTALFSNVGGYNPELTFDRQREEFFLLVYELLEAGKIKFVSPKEIWSADKDIWEVPSKEIIDYLRSKWPDGAESEAELVEYFFEIPPVLWVGEDGKLIGS